MRQAKKKMGPEPKDDAPLELRRGYHAAKHAWIEAVAAYSTASTALMTRRSADWREK